MNHHFLLNLFFVCLFLDNQISTILYSLLEKLGNAPDMVIKLLKFRSCPSMTIIIIVVIIVVVVILVEVMRFFWRKNDCCFSVGLFMGPTFMFPALFRQFYYIQGEGGGYIQRILEQCIFLFMFDA